MKLKLLIALLCWFGVVSAQPKSPLNGFALEDDTTNSYSFWVSGHFYGNGTNKTGYPANTLLGNIDMLNASDAKMMVCLGDLFLDIKNDIPYYEQSLFKRLKIPLFNAVGNHDITDDVYQSNYGDTYYYFEYKGDIHLILDTEKDDGDIEDDQLEMLKEVEKHTAKGNVANVFVYAHRTVFKESIEEMDGILEDNTQSLTANNFESEVLPVAAGISKNSKLYWFAGSIGGEAPASFLYHEDETTGITYIATAIRGLPRDAFLKVISTNGKVKFEAVSLTGQKLLDLEEYNIAFWQNNSGREPFNWRLFPLYVKQTVLSWSFLFGGISAFLLLFAGRAIKRKFSK